MATIPFETGGIIITDIPETESWQESSNCMGINPDLFFPVTGASVEEAKGVCQSCEVREDCLEFALVNGVKSRVMGGHTEDERQSIVNQRNQAARTVIDLSDENRD